jgi:NSS family neurotransmitter:Na+ symporter
LRGSRLGLYDLDDTGERWLPQGPLSNDMTTRQRWATKTGLILALAGNAVGLGNFLRFPVQAAQNGGGAFMIPYFAALVLVGLPMMWVECAIGRLGGKHGHGHTAGMLALLWDHPAAKYIGVLGIFIPFTVALYYSYITSWCLAFSVFSLTGSYAGLTTRETMEAFLSAFQGVAANEHFSSVATAYGFYVATLLIILLVLYGGVAKGIERLAKVAMPLLFVFGALIAIRVLLLGTPDPSAPERNVLSGLGFVWNPDFSRLGEPKVWVSAAGQIFFTLAVGWGIIHTYVSYLDEDDDIVLTGMSTAGLNELAEVVIGGTIALTAAVVFFGVAGTEAIARGGAFDLGFAAMPLIFQKIPFGSILGAFWFLLLFFAGLTSAVAMGQPLIALLQENWAMTRPRAVAILGTAMFALTQPVIFYQRFGFLDELDFWVGAVGLAVFGALEILVFGWIFGMERGWAEILRGAEIRPPALFKSVIQYVTPAYLIGILAWWAVTDMPHRLALRGVPEEARPYLVFGRLMTIGILFVITALVRHASRTWAPLDGDRRS